MQISLLHSANMKEYNWSYTQFSQFNADDSLLLVSGVFVGPRSSSSGEIAVISLGKAWEAAFGPSIAGGGFLGGPAGRSLNVCPLPLPENFSLLSRVRNKPYDVFGCWLNETNLISGNFHRIGYLTSCSVLWLNNAFQVRGIPQPGHRGAGGLWPAFRTPQPRPPLPFPRLLQGVESENVNVVKRLFKIQNLNASTIRTVMVVDCSRYSAPDLLLDRGEQPAGGACITPQAGSGSKSCTEDAEPPTQREDPAADKPLEADGEAVAGDGLDNFLTDILEGRVRPVMTEFEMETKVAQLLAKSRTKPPDPSLLSLDGKKYYLIFTTGCLTYSPHQIGKRQIQALSGGGGVSNRLCSLKRGSQCKHGWDPRHRYLRVPSSSRHSQDIPPTPSHLSALPTGVKQILPHQMTTAGPVLGEERNSERFFDALDHVIELHGHIIGMGLSPDHR